MILLVFPAFLILSFILYMYTVQCLTPSKNKPTGNEKQWLKIGICVCVCALQFFLILKLLFLQCLPCKKAAEMFDVKAWAVYIVEWAAKDPYGFLTTVILVLTPLFIISAALSWKLAKMIETREREQKKKRKRQENIVKAKRAKKD